MKLSTFLFLNEKNLMTGVKVKFAEVETPQGKAMSFTSSDGNKYVIAASVDNFNRFAKWNGKESSADILPLRKKMKTKNGTFPLAKLRTDVEIEKGENEVPEKDEEGNQVF